MPTLSKDQLRAIRADIDAALKPVAEKYGLATLAAGNATFDPKGWFSFKLDGRLDGGETKEAMVYDANARLYGLPPRGTKVPLSRGEYEITGLKGRSDNVIVSKGNDHRLIKIDALIGLLQRIEKAKSFVA